MDCSSMVGVTVEDICNFTGDTVVRPFGYGS